MPRKGVWVSVCLVLMAMPLLIPWNVVGAMWNIFALPDIGLLGKTLNSMGFDYNFTRQPVAAWVTLIAMDVWHWTSLVVLLSYAGLSSIPDAYYQAARIDGASVLGGLPLHPAAQAQARADHRRAAALHGQLQDLHRALRAHRRRSGQLHHLAVASTWSRSRWASSTSDRRRPCRLIYFLIILLLSWIFYTVMTRGEDN